MLAHLLAKPTHALPRVQVRSRAPGQARSRASGCKTASRKNSFFSRLNSRMRCAPAHTAPRETALFLVASVSGATDYNYFRSYQPNQGRYTQADPIGLDGGWNRFSYVGANPLSSIDPLGLWSIGFELYGGIGGGVTLTCSDGKLEIISRLGTGVGGGFGFDPLQGASPHSVGSAGSIGRTFGTIGAEAKVPTLSVGGAATVRTGNAVTTKVGGGYGETSLPQFGMGNWQAKLGFLAAFGVEFGGYIDSKLCTCK